MTFGEPTVLIAGAIALPIILLLIAFSSHRRKKALNKFADPELLEQLSRNISRPRRRIKAALLFFAFILIMLALARPQWGYRWTEVRAQGVDVVIAMDVSKSMLAQDVSPDRLTRARFAVYDLITRIRGNRLGIVAFAGKAFLQCPLTLDFDAVQKTLETLDPEIIPLGGSDLGIALKEAAAAFDKKDNSKFIILISDGEDLNQNGVKVAAELANEGIRIFTIGIGTVTGELIPLNEGGVPDFQRDPSGNVVRTKLEPETLRGIAANGNGEYLELASGNGSLFSIIREIESARPSDISNERLKRIPMERYGWFLLPGILLLALEFLISTRSREKTLMVFLLCGLVAGTLTPTPAHAQQETSRPIPFERSPEAAYNAGVNLYRGGAFADAEQAFYEALNTENASLYESALYNLANTLVQQSLQTEDPESQKSLLERAIRHYEEALKQADSADTRFNLELARKLLEEIQPPEKEPTPPQEQQQDSSDKKDQNEESKQQDQDNQEESEQGEADSQEESSPSDSGQQQQNQNGEGQSQPQQQDGQSDNSGEQSQPQDASQPQEEPTDSPQNKENTQNQPEGESDEQPQETQSGSQSEEQQQNNPREQMGRPQGSSPDTQQSVDDFQLSNEEQTSAEEDAQSDVHSGTMNPVEEGMSREDALRVLNSLRNNERKLPVTLEEGITDRNSPLGNQIRDW